MKTIIALVLTAFVAAPASAQIRPLPPPFDDRPSISLRPFFVFAQENFTARKTFDAVFGKSSQPFFGGGLSVAFKKGFYFDVTASRFKKTGERAFFSDGQSFGLGIPLTATLTPLEVTAGVRFRITPRLFPYAGGGAGSYRYQETSQFEDAPFDQRHVGYLVVGGVEFRISRWVGISGDAQYTRVPGIIGSGGVSKEAGESDLGGTSGRVRVIVGR